MLVEKNKEAIHFVEMIKFTSFSLERRSSEWDALSACLVSLENSQNDCMLLILFTLDSEDCYSDFIVCYVSY
jgi:hypothetical protein